MRVRIIKTNYSYAEKVVGKVFNATRPHGYALVFINSDELINAGVFPSGYLSDGRGIPFTSDEYEVIIPLNELKRNLGVV